MNLLRITEFLVGLLFGTGLIVSGMADPAKVLAFLDVAGQWDPSLALVMCAAIGVSLLAFAIAKRRTHSLLGEPVRLAPSRRIDRRVLGGSVVFGIGWGLVGFCPGPALVAGGTGSPKALAFVAAMMGGMLVFEVLQRASHRTPLDASASFSDS